MIFLGLEHRLGELGLSSLEKRRIQEEWKKNRRRTEEESKKNERRIRGESEENPRRIQEESLGVACSAL